MTAIGFVLLFAGWLIGSLFGSPNPYFTNAADKVAVIMYLSGLLLALAGAAAWLWRVMP